MRRRTVLLLLLALPVTALLAEEGDWATDPLALAKQLSGIEATLAQGMAPSEAEVTLAGEIKDGVEAEGTRSMRTRSGVVAYLVGEAASRELAVARAEEEVRAALEVEKALVRAARGVKIRSIGLGVSLGACGLLAGAYDVLQYLGEAAYARYASSKTVAEAESAGRLAATIGIASTVTAGAFLAAVASLLAFLGAGAISPP